METGSAAGVSGTSATEFEMQASAWESEGVETTSNGWRTENTQVGNDIQLNEETYDSIVGDLVTKMGVEMVKQQNPAEKSKFSLDDDE